MKCLFSAPFYVFPAFCIPCKFFIHFYTDTNFPKYFADTSLLLTNDFC